MPIFTRLDPDKPADINTKEPLDLRKTDLLGLLAHEANRDKSGVVMALMKLIKEGDGNAIKLLKEAFDALKPQDVKNKPIPILGGITQRKKN